MRVCLPGPVQGPRAPEGCVPVGGPFFKNREVDRWGQQWPAAPGRSEVSSNDSDPGPGVWRKDASSFSGVRLSYNLVPQTQPKSPEYKPMSVLQSPRSAVKDCYLPTAATACGQHQLFQAGIQVLTGVVSGTLPGPLSGTYYPSEEWDLGWLGLEG